MKERIKRLFNYVVERGKEASTWAGLSPVFLLVHVHLSTDQFLGVTALGVLVCGALAAVIKET